MAQPLPRLRPDLDTMPSPVEGRPGWLIRDPFHYSDAVLIVPPALGAGLECFDGERTELDLRQELTRITGDLEVGGIVTHLMETLSNAGFLLDEKYESLKEQAIAEFAKAPIREAVHAGNAYPAEANELDGVMRRYMDGAIASYNGVSANGNLVGIAAPHVSPEGGWNSYRAAYQALGPEYRDRTFIILGTSHYGAPDRFGLSRKPFVTPYGAATTDVDFVNLIAALAGPAVQMEDYCHSMEHSIEFQVVFLQHLFGPDVKIVPILCGSYARSLYLGGRPEDNDDVYRFLSVLGEQSIKERHRMMYVLGVDMAHMGRRYRDDLIARADEGEMLAVAERDRLRIESINISDARGFWEQVQEDQDPLKWCGSAPFYTFLKVAPGVQGSLERYEQWNIDEQSVVSFAGMTFREV